jgi:hypothetical protein
MRAIFVMFMLMLAGCASGSGSDKEVAAVVQSETARQAAAETVQAGESSEAALKAAAEAAPAAATQKAEPSR